MDSQQRSAIKRSFRAMVVEVLIEHTMALEERREQRTETVWPDESDIYTTTIEKLRDLYKRKMRSEGWTPPSGAGSEGSRG